MTEYIEFDVMRALIFYQQDYSGTRQVDCDGCRSCQDLDTTRTDAVNAAEIAQGFKIPWERIGFFRNKSKTEIV